MSYYTVETSGDINVSELADELRQHLDFSDEIQEAAGEAVEEALRYADITDFPGFNDAVEEVVDERLSGEQSLDRDFVYKIVKDYLAATSVTRDESLIPRIEALEATLREIGKVINAPVVAFDRHPIG